MPLSRIRIDLAKMKGIASTFDHQAEAVRIEIGSLKQKLGLLRAGDWTGSAADKFYREMEAAVLPALQHLAVALETSAQTTAQIAKIMHQTETEVAAIF